MYYIYIMLMLLCLLSLMIFLTFRKEKPSDTTLIFKTFASIAFVFIGAMDIIHGGTPTKALIFIGLVCGLIGDIMIELKLIRKGYEFQYLNFGTLMFSMGHILYYFAIVYYVSTKTVTGFGWASLCSLLCGLVVSAIIMLNSKRLKLDFTGFKVQSYCYSSLLLFLALTSLCLCLADSMSILLAVGFALFYVSDLLLSYQFFGRKTNNRTLTILNHVFYYAAQLCIASFAFFI